MDLTGKIQRLYRKILVAFGLRKKKVKDTPQFWREDEEFHSLYRAVKGKTLVTPDRCFMIYQLAKCMKNRKGDFAEVGVYKGGTARIIAQVAPTKAFHLFDTFRGMPQANKNVDKHKKGDFSDTSLDAVQDFLNSFDHIRYYPGLFPETAKSLDSHNFSFVHVDVDIYDSIKVALEFFYPRLNPGGIMIFDDYQWIDTPGIKIALDEFLTDKKEFPIKIALYQAMIIKT